MNPGDALEVRNGYASKTVKVVLVARGRVIVDWPLVGEYHVDLLTGELYMPPGYAMGVFEVDTVTGRVIGTRASVVPEELPLLDGVQVGTPLRLDNGTRGEVVDALHSEGTVKIFVGSTRASSAWRSGALRSSYRVTPVALRQLRQAAGLVSAMAS